MYALKLDPAAEAVYDALPPQASENLTRALAMACEHPLDATHPYGVDDKVIRQIITPDVRAILLVGHNTRTIAVLQLDYLG
ncbi:hypothetical protein [Streptomyces katrae]|uniref:hypothetical protein n=1 Tax=Streptomyces katrae TaxID=68223 RepID=UPI00055D2723|nr:hypothetical protein [Streptomyces katrae]